MAFSYKRRGFCPSCAGRRMAQTAAHGRMCHALSADTPMGRIGANTVALLDVGIACLDGTGAYHRPHHHRAISRQPSGQTRCQAAQRAARIGLVYPTIRRKSQCESPLWPRARKVRSPGAESLVVAVF